jgi:hypothetical protein
MRRLALLLMIASLALAGDLTGKWSGTFVDTTTTDGSGKTTGAYMDLKLSAQTVTGTAGPDETHQMVISNGKLEGKKLTFDVVQPGGTLKFDLTFDGESLQGAASSEKDGLRMSAKLDLKRKA